MSQSESARTMQTIVDGGAASRLSRRSLLRGAAAVGAAVPVAASGGGSVAQPAAAAVAWQADPATLTIAMNGSPSDLDPHSVYDYRSAMPLRGPYESLIALDGSATDSYVPVIAESWEPNEDKSVWTFTIRSGVTFHDGTPVDAEAVRKSFERFLTMGLGPAGAMRRFIQEPEQITAPDASTVVFDCGAPQPLLEAYLSSQYGPLVLNVDVAMQNEVDGDLGHAWAMLNEEGLGTGPYRIVSFEPEEQLILERFAEYWGGWEGSHFDRVIFRVVPENETRRQLIEQGEVDIVDNLTPEANDALVANPELVIDRSYSAEVDYIILTEAGPLATPEARQAMCWAFPYDEVVEGVFAGMASAPSAASPSWWPGSLQRHSSTRPISTRRGSCSPPLACRKAPKSSSPRSQATRTSPRRCSFFSRIWPRSASPSASSRSISAPSPGSCLARWTPRNVPT